MSIGGCRCPNAIRESCLATWSLPAKRASIVLLQEKVSTAPLRRARSIAIPHVQASRMFRHRLRWKDNALRTPNRFDVLEGIQLDGRSCLIWPKSTVARAPQNPCHSPVLKSFPPFKPSIKACGPPAVYWLSGGVCRVSCHWWSTFSTRWDTTTDVSSFRMARANRSVVSLTIKVVSALPMPSAI